MTEGETDFDVIVVGAGPAGSAAALKLARLGRNVCLIERGPFPGSKNMYGGVIYGRILDELIPQWWEVAPVQRWVTRRATMVLTETQSLTIDFRTQAWADPPYNGATAFRPDFDSWLAGVATEAGASLVTSTTVTGLLKDSSGAVSGVKTDRPGGELRSKVVIACDGVNSFLAKEAGMYRHPEPGNFTLGAKEVLRLPKEVIEERFGLTGRDGADFEILGGTGAVAGGGFIYTNLDSVSVGVVLHLPQLAASGKRPEELIAGLKSHPAIAPLVRGGELIEYSAHVIPEGGLDMMPDLHAGGMLVAGDAAAMCLAAGIWLEGVNFAIASGVAAAETADKAVESGNVSAAGLSSYPKTLSDSFVLADHKKLRRAPHLVLSDRVQQRYPQLMCNLVEEMFTVRNPAPKPGGRAVLRSEAKKAGVRIRDLAGDTMRAMRIFG